MENPGGAATTRQSLGIGGIDTAATQGKAKRAVKPGWPKAIVARVLALRAALEALGQARKLDGDRFAA